LQTTHVFSVLSYDTILLLNNTLTIQYHQFILYYKNILYSPNPIVPFSFFTCFFFNSGRSTRTTFTFFYIFQHFQDDLAILTYTHTLLCLFVSLFCSFSLVYPLFSSTVDFSMQTRPKEPRNYRLLSGNSSRAMPSKPKKQSKAKNSKPEVVDGGAESDVRDKGASPPYHPKSFKSAF
jgi:hypothetical protein